AGPVRHRLVPRTQPRAGGRARRRRVRRPHRRRRRAHALAGGGDPAARARRTPGHRRPRAARAGPGSAGAALARTRLVRGGRLMQHPLLLQLVVIIATARGCGLLLRYVGPPPVIGEMAAGTVLGPIVFGALFPEFHARLFAPDSLPALSSLATLGLVLFMFIVGVELRSPEGVRAQLKSAGWVGVLSVLVPAASGVAVSPALYP